MKILAIETATMLGGLAIMDDQTLLAESRINVRVTHSERLMKELDHALTSAGLSLEDIDVFGISAGPGSFTGLRVGYSTIKGLVYSTGKRFVAVPTLEAFAWNVPFAGCLVCPLLDARRKEVYGALFRWTGDGFARVIAEQAIRIGDLLSGINAPTIFLGEGAVLNQDVIRRTLGDRALFGAPQHMVPSPANVAALCVKKAMAGDYMDAMTAAPAYLRRSEAEIKFGA
ncbi:MAG TPA: tRNA (adenosine(37)-N6)-threonylcarbamoyltransferase complex dimerization subunit type 1 TsaB [Dissulfurispiraceae bacterium]|nr:tRNA (adenosine(37)-N6)-threonylcarbamoyltransferase complex dimerization subunit type 1 TsaB [Dissulfurispiraceae bacterium]